MFTYLITVSLLLVSVIVSSDDCIFSLFFVKMHENSSNETVMKRGK